MTLRMIPELQEGTYRAKASGTLPNGKPVIVNSDGTVSVVVETDVTQGVGSPSVFDTSTTSQMSAGFDSSSGKVVVAYRDEGNSNQGTAIVGTVSGTSISFGTAVVFETGDTRSTSVAFDSNSNKIIISYEDDTNSSYGTAIVGTVSGTSISFGTPVVFYSDTVSGPTVALFDASNSKVVIAYRTLTGGGQAVVGTVSGTSISFGSNTTFDSSSIASMSAAFDPTNSKLVVAYSDGGNSDRGTAIVGTVSGTSISFGSAVAFSSSYIAEESSITFDSSNEKFVISYIDGANSDAGTAIVGTVSGTSISFGTAVVFESAYMLGTVGVFDSNASKVVISYKAGFSGDGKVIVGTVSGTSISFGTAVVFDNADRYFISSTFDSTSNKVVIVYRDSDNSDRGTSAVFQNASTDTNLTAENYIGLSKGGTVADGSSVTVDIIDTTNGEQSGLTAGESYYVQGDGTLGTTPADPEVFAGTAISATELLVKG